MDCFFFKGTPVISGVSTMGTGCIERIRLGAFFQVLNDSNKEFFRNSKNTQSESILEFRILGAFEFQKTLKLIRLKQ